MHGEQEIAVIVESAFLGVRSVSAPAGMASRHRKVRHETTMTRATSRRSQAANDKGESRNG